MKIALLTPGITPYVMGGMQRHSFNLARHLARLGVEIDLYHTDFGAAEGIDGLEGFSAEEAVQVTSMPVRWPERWRYPGHYLGELKAFSAEVRRQMQMRPPVDAVYGQGLTAWKLVEANRKGANGPPVMVNLHGFEMFQPPPSWRSVFDNRMMRPSFGTHARRADRVVSLGGKLTELIEKRVGVPRERIVELPVGIDPEWVNRAIRGSTNRLRFVFVGRCERRKGIEELDAVIASHPEWRERTDFCFIGPIPEKRRLRLPHVNYLGAVRDEEILRAELAQSDVLLCPSHSEGMPTVILEGMASGLAVIATDVGAVAVLVDERNGMLIPQPEKAQLASAIGKMLELDRGDLDSMKEVSLDRVREFSWDKVARKTYDELKRWVSVE